MDDEEAALAQVGKTVGEKYRLVSVLGAGGMGAVYEAEHLFTKRRVALKRMHQGIARSKHAAERFVREAEAPSAIGHPGIVQVLDGGLDGDGSLFLVLELLDGVSMNDAMEANALEAPAITQIGIELLEALAAAHAKGFIHRDIKPDNVFLANDGRGGIAVKLLDFGIASVRTLDGEAKLTKTGSILGTPLYMSPEQAQGARIDARSDLWSVGAMLYRALAGKAPYDGDTYNALIVSIVTQRHAPLAESRPDLPAGLLEAVERALRKAPAERFDDAEQMCAALRAVQFTAAAPELMPPLSSLRPTVDDRHIDIAPPRSAGAMPLKETRAASASRSVQREVATRAAEPAATRAARPVRAREAADAPAVEPATPPAARPVEPEPARPKALVPLAVGIGLCALAALGIAALRNNALPARAASAQLAAREQSRDAIAARETRRDQPEEPAPIEEPKPSPSSREPAPASAPAVVKPAPPAAEPAPVRHDPHDLPPEALTGVIAAQQDAMQHCLEESVVAQMVAGPVDKGPFRLDISLKIAPSGSVQSADVLGQAPADLVRCVKARLLAAEFPRAEAPTRFRYPLVLTPTIVGQ